MKLEVSYDYIKPNTSAMSPMDALREAKIYKDDSNYPYMNDLAQIVLDKGSPYNATFWVVTVKTHIEEMFAMINNINNYENLESYYDRLITFHSYRDYQYDNIYNTLLHSNNAYAYAQILMNTQRRSPYSKDEIMQFKLRIIELSLVEDVVMSMYQNSAITTDKDSLIKEFYKDVPIDYQLGIVL